MNIEPSSPTEQKERSNFGQFKDPFSAPPILKIPSVQIGFRDKPEPGMLYLNSFLHIKIYLKILMALGGFVVHSQYLDNQLLLVDFLLDLTILN